jgi:hypothetical protein
MTVDTWLKCAVEDAERRGAPELRPLLEHFAVMMRVLAAADFNERADGRHS